jgi:hypothetical protein
VNKRITTLPRDVAEVPTDLLTPTEREWNGGDSPAGPVWVRNAYSPGTDARWQELLESYTDGLLRSANDAQRYNITDDMASFAFFPFLLQAGTWNYADPDVPDDAPELLQHLYLTDFEDTLAKEKRLTAQQEWLFVADDQAMRTGFIEWRMFDEYGNALFKERIQPWSLQQATASRIYKSPEDFRKDIARGYYGNDPKYSSDVLQPWEPLDEDVPDGSLMSAAMQNLQVLGGSVSDGRVSNSESS